MQSTIITSSLFLCLLSCNTLASSADWPTYRGNPERTAISAETGLLQSWPEGGPRLAWSKTDLGSARSSPIAVNGLVYIKTPHQLQGFDIKTGEKKWSGKIKIKDSTPAIADNKVVGCSDGTFSCVDLNTGEQLWSIKIDDIVPNTKDLKIKYSGWGQSILIVDDKVIITTGNTSAPVIALDLHTGSVAWKSPTPKLAFNRGYASPVFCQRQDTRMVLNHFATVVAAVHVDDGSILWEYKTNNDDGWRRRGFLAMGNSFQLYKDLLIGGGIYAGPTVQNTLSIAEDGRSVKAAWHHNHIRTAQEGIMIYKDLVYATGRLTWKVAEDTPGLLINGKSFADFKAGYQGEIPQNPNKYASKYIEYGDSKSVGLLCMDPLSGKPLGIRYGMSLQSWGGHVGSGHLIVAADNRLIVAATGNQRLVWLIEPGPAMEIRGSFTNPKGTNPKKPESGDVNRWSSPAISHGHLFMRLNGELRAFDLRAAGAK